MAGPSPVRVTKNLVVPALHRVQQSGSFLRIQAEEGAQEAFAAP